MANDCCRERVVAFPMAGRKRSVLCRSRHSWVRVARRRFVSCCHCSTERKRLHPSATILCLTANFVTLDPIGVERDFAQCLPEIERHLVTATQGPTSVKALGRSAISPAWKKKPS